METLAVVGLGAGCVACFGAFVALIVVTVVVSARKERERLAALAHWAGHHHWARARL